MGQSSNLENILEAVLFTYGEPLGLKKLCAVTERSHSEVISALENLKDSLAWRGIRLVSKSGEWQLAAASNASAYVEKLIKREMQEELTPAGLEILAVAAYRGPVSKAEIEAIRGVNCAYGLSNLVLRGLIEKNERAKPHTYEISLAALRKLGLEQLEDLPKYHEHRLEIQKTENLLSQTNYS